ncbi:MAG: DUF4179 domain-containing protein [Alphaproteobacteria bacterium]|nr:DUF4179 domain-containing protein [Alphaproteobacteria bacterium]
MSVNLLRDAFLFLLANAIGFSSPTLAYYTASLTGFFVPGDTGGHQILLHEFYQGTLMTWMVCALFSLGFFFVRGPLRYIFLLVSAFIPFAYGFSVLGSAGPL